MKFFSTGAALGVFFVVLFCSGCISTSPQVPVQTPGPTPSMTTAAPATPTFIPTPVASPFPEALTIGQYATFGSGDQTGKATVFRYELTPNYNWTTPSFNSPGEQAAASQPNEIERGYNTEMAKPGDTFLFIHVSVIDTGTSAVYAPSPSQFVVYADGSLYNYTSVHGSDVVIDKFSGTQYDYQIGRGGTVGYIQPGESNKAEGYLIYEVPASISPHDTYVLANLDYRTQAVWRLE
jgi:hypothetical protein